MIHIVITKDDLDNKTVKILDKKLVVPGAEIEVLDSLAELDTETHYSTASPKVLKHVETGAVWEANVVTMHERGATVTENFTATPSVEATYTTTYARFSVNATSAVDGKRYVRSLEDVSFAGYTNAKDFNEKHAGKKLTFTVPDRFAEVGDRPKVLGTTVELDYPQLPYDEGTTSATLSVGNTDPNLNINYENDAIKESAMNVAKTVHYKLTRYDGHVYEGTKTLTGNVISGQDLAYDLDYSASSISKVEYSVEPFRVSSFFSDVTVTSSPISKVIGDQL